MNIFIGNLSPHMDESTLKTIFSEYGQIKSLNLVKDDYTHRSRGFGYVEMWSESDAVNAIRNLNNKSFNGKRMMVNTVELQNW